MKKSILISCLALSTLSVTAYAYMNWSRSEPAPLKGGASCKKPITAYAFNYALNPIADADLLYDVSSRFLATIAKDKLHGAISILDIIPAEGKEGLENFHTVSVGVIRDGKDVIEEGQGDALNAAQMKLLQTADYSTNIHINSLCMKRNATSGELENYELVYYITVTPEKEAFYLGGREALIAWLKANLEEETAIIEKDKLRPGQVSFTVTREGTVEDVRLTSSCGYATVDEALVEQIRSMPQRWTPATDAKGEFVDQGLVFFFGMQGC